MLSLELVQVANPNCETAVAEDFLALYNLEHPPRGGQVSEAGGGQSVLGLFPVHIRLNSLFHESELGMLHGELELWRLESMCRCLGRL